ncbi:TonB-linked outer membrane protein, SusC/RagA family [Chryseolinea serpens]|uniref:TonB-linked outer membrane protein, SusC/RagA family n=1 Tax=Chryseolinea serpens TaxID=947013 RepID=A0A1M5MVY2_9BACT|nr:TonB-dependent receptor [Chryseolinea serpens]SHG81480.1 TonB-linked outer membrane protein, SusC/RagA family [Chryseolinea serpens]
MRKSFTTTRAFLLLGCMLYLLGSPSFAFAQDGSVKGKVVSDVGEVLPGVNVLIKGSSRGTTTDADGQFVLGNVTPADVLVFSFIGYTTQELTVGNQTTLNITLTTDMETLGEVVVVGYGTQRKIETTGSIASVKSSDLVQTPVSNVVQGLQGRVAGVQITQNSGAPGGNVSVRVRGTNSINGTSEPLYVIDGIQIANSGNITDVSPLSTINPSDIESVEVLKDASATAIYGARGSNGVVLITTKRGKSGTTRVSYEGYYGVQQVRKELDMLNAAQFAQLENDVFKSQVYADPAAEGQGVNWQDLIFRTAPIQNHQLSVNGGTDKTQLALSLNYFNQDGIIINSNFKRYSLRLNLDHKISDRVKVGTSIMGSYNINSGIPTGSQTVGDADVVTGSIVGAALGAPPTLRPYRDDGTLYPFGEQRDGRYREVTNPLGLASVKNQTDIRRVMANIYGEATLVKGLTYRASFNADVQENLNNYYSPLYIIATKDINANSGSAKKDNRNNLVLLHESILTYAKTLADVHSLKFTGVFATQSVQFNQNTINANGFPNDATTNESLQIANTVSTSSLRTKERLDSYMGRVNYGYKDKYFFDITARVDGSSKFGANHKYGFFPAASAAWRINEEAFMQDVDVISDLKLRASFGRTGNAGAIDPYKSLSLQTTSSLTSPGGGDYQFNHAYTKGISPSGIANPDLRWEKSTQLDIGLDVSFLDDRIGFTVDVYKKDTKDLLYEKTLPLSSGYPSIITNLGGIQNKGVELAVNARVIDHGDFKWNLSANFTANRNKVTDIDGGVTNERFITTYTLLKVGQPLGLFKTYLFDGIYQTGETIIPGSDGRIGGTKVKDYNGDGVITSADQVITGNPNPKFIYGLSTNLSYKNFDLSVFVSGTYGNDIYNVSRASFENPLGQRNLLAGVANHWTADNPNNEYASPLQGGRLPITDRFVENGSYLRCKNITLGYRLPAIKGINSARIYVSTNNLFTITKYTGYDPEVNTYAGSNTAIGVDNLVYPAARSVLGGIQVTF